MCSKMSVKRRNWNIEENGKMQGHVIGQENETIKYNYNHGWFKLSKNQIQWRTKPQVCIMACLGNLPKQNYTYGLTCTIGCA